jgi:thiol-disulfide isomerase/thioredoxin
VMYPTNLRKLVSAAHRNSFPLVTFIVVALIAISPTIQSPAQSSGGVNSQTSHPQVADGLVPIHARKHAPDLSVTDLAGSSIALSQYRGKVVLLDFWAVDCGLCVTEIPWWVEFDKKYHEKGLQPIGLDMLKESPSYIKPFMKKWQMNYPVALGNDDIQKRFQVEGLPKTILIDRQGRVAVSQAGIVDRDAFARDIEELLTEH